LSFDKRGAGQGTVPGRKLGKGRENAVLLGGSVGSGARFQPYTGPSPNARVICQRCGAEEDKSSLETVPETPINGRWVLVSGDPPSWVDACTPVER